MAIDWNDYDPITPPDNWKPSNRSTQSVSTERQVIGFIRAIEAQFGSANGWSVRVRDTRNTYEIGQRLPNGTYLYKLLASTDDEGALNLKRYLRLATTVSAAFALAIGSATSQGTVVSLNVPDGNYTVTEPITLVDGVRLRLQPNAKIIADPTFVGEYLVGSSKTALQNYGRIEGGQYDCAGVANKGIYVGLAAGFKVRKLKVLNCRGIGAQLGDTVANGANSSSYECELSSVTLENPRNFVANAGSIGVMVYATDSYISRVVPVGYETGLRDQGGRTITTWCTSGRTPRTAR